MFEGRFVRVIDQAFARDAHWISKDVALAAHWPRPRAWELEKRSEVEG
jgi:hypothetical protein